METFVREVTYISRWETGCPGVTIRLEYDRLERKLGPNRPDVSSPTISVPI